MARAEGWQCLPFQVTPDDASEASTRGEAVQDFVSSPQVCDPLKLYRQA